MTKDELQALAQEFGFDLAGAVPASDFASVPAWAASIVVLGMAALDPGCDLEMYIEVDGQRRWSKWSYERIVAGASRLALWLSRAGHRSETLTFEKSLALLDLKAAAVRAGLGVMGLNNLVLARRFGPRIRFGAIFTELELAPGRPLHDYYCVSCSLCIAACPTGALGPKGLDRSRCIAEFEPDAAMAAVQRRLLRFPTPHTRCQCSACIDACPLGRKLHTRFWGLDPC